MRRGDTNDLKSPQNIVFCRLKTCVRTMNIRLEQAQDYREVENLTREALWNVYRPGCTEHYVLNQYRNNPDFIPELDFVVEENGHIIGHVMFSKAEITLDDGTVFPSWTFVPISIHPEYKRKGYGLKLLQHALEKAKAMGIGLLQMEGNIDFYKHAGAGIPADGEGLGRLCEVCGVLATNQ